jgi:hypothetical protein
MMQIEILTGDWNKLLRCEEQLPTGEAVQITIHINRRSSQTKMFEPLFLQRSVYVDSYCLYPDSIRILIIRLTLRAR